MILLEEHPGELACGIEVGPVDGRATTAGDEDEGLEGGVQGGQQPEVGRFVGVPVARVAPRGLHPPPLPAQHLWKKSTLALTPGTYSFSPALLDRRSSPPEAAEGGGLRAEGTIADEDEPAKGSTPKLGLRIYTMSP